MPMRSVFLVASLGILVALAVTSCGRVPGLVRWYMRADDRVIWYQPDVENLVALTIDDGPAVGATAEILDVLDEHDARATFFLIGSHAAREGEIVRRILREGHEVGNHMLFDQPSARLSPETLRTHFVQTDSILRSFGARPAWFRPGAGRFNENMLDLLCEKGAAAALGDVYPFDTLITSEDFAADYVVRRARPGSVLILHDGPERGRRTARVLARALPLLRRAGYRVVSLTELVGEQALASAVAGCEWRDAGAANRHARTPRHSAIPGATRSDPPPAGPALPVTGPPI